MVKTRQNDYQNESLASGYVKRVSKQSSRLHGYECNGSDSSDYSCLGKRRSHLRMMPSSKYARTANDRVASADVATSPVRTRKSQRDRAVKDENAVENGYDENDHSELMEDKSPNNSANSIRRSTRRRKTLYDTLNQSWILGSKIRDFSNIEQRVLRESEKMARKQEMMDDDDDDNSADEDYDDMYSRVKRKRRTRMRNYQSLRSDKKGLELVDGSSNEGDTEENEEQDELDEPELDETRVTEEPQWDSKSSDEDVTQDGVKHPKYYLRQKKPTINRFQFPIDPPRNRKVTSKSAFHLSPAHHKSRFQAFRSPARRNPFQRRRHATHNSSSSSSDSSSCSSSEDEHRFERRKAKSMARARSRCLPMNFNNNDVTSGVLADRLKVGNSLADINPMTIDRAVSFENVGGLRKHIDALKEMVIFPLLYPEVFEKFKISPPRGVLFFGSPGTGKTLVARALANECCQGEKRIAFFMRKGADCLSKWVGESERQLRLLFDQAFIMRPSIIFFDEIDGLAPVRSSRQDQIHSSIVSTLLALMDGLDNRGEVVVIGATNRIDAIDPALRRPGRFDREFHFPLPSLEDRCSILKIHTKEWTPKLSSGFLTEIAKKTVGYCGADLKALCAEVGLLALKRRYPQIYKSHQKLQLDISSIRVEAKDFSNAMYKIVPASQRSSAAVGHALSVHMQPLLQSMLNKTLKALQEIFPIGFSEKKEDGDNETDEENNFCSIYESENNTASLSTDQDNASCKRIFGSSVIPSHRPRVLLTGKADQGQSTHLAPAVLYHLEHLPVHKLDLPTLYAVTAKAPEEACSQVFAEACRTLPGILYLPHLDQWWDTLSDTVRATFLTLLHDVEPGASLLLVATCDCVYDDLPDEVKKIFSCFQGEVVEMQHPTKEERREFFVFILQYIHHPPKRIIKTANTSEDLPLAQLPIPRMLNESELHVLEEQEESTFRELRLFLREILYKLARDRRFTVFSKPVDVSEVPDYLDVIKQPMDLEAMLTKIDMHQYETVCQFLEDVDLICHNALEYNPDRDPSDKLIRHRACALRDAAHALVDSELDPEFEKMCREIVESRKSRGCPPNKFAPKNYHTIPPLVEGSPQSSSNDNDQNPKRFSRRLRGLSVGSPAVTDTENKKPPNEKVKRVIASPGGSTEIIVRRKSSLWFGSRRYVIRRFRNPVSSDSPKKETIPREENVLSDDARNSQTSNLSSLTDIEHVEDKAADERVEQKPTDEQTDTKAVDVEMQNCNSDKIGVDCATKSPLGDENTNAEQNVLSPSGTNHEVTSVEPMEVSNDVHEQETDSMPAIETREVIVDEDRLKRLIDTLVNVTKYSNIEALERLSCSLRRSIAHHRKEWDKTALLEELEWQVNAFKKFPNS